ncbi:acyltransferase [Rickettsia endosymbiont of Seladonia tumulorum]|uniref:acyltransferase n=1 Tax=Rickettsia endosymbiont of Seladonia tumulorum TaxID=3066270 RepID=UPI00313F2C80
MTMKIDNNRIVWVDLVKTLAIVMVVLLHSIAPSFYKYSSIPFSKSFILSNFIDSFCRVAVPLFILTSGFLALKGNISIEKLWYKIKRLLIPLIFWSTLYKYWISYNTSETFNIFSALNSIFRKPAMYHLGFVYYMLGVYLLFPILALIVNEMLKSKKFACYFLVLWFAINSVNYYYLFSIIKWMAINNFFSYSGYAVLGAYLIRKNIGLKFSRYYWLILYLLVSSVTFIITWILNVNSVNPDEKAYWYLSPNVVIAAIGMFLALQNINIPVKYNILLKCISENCFVIFFVHVWILVKLESKMISFSSFNPTNYPIFGSIVLAVITFIASLLISIVIRKIPHSQKLVG